ncbi:MAG: phytoene/squalene synthase family protein [Acidobacteria bacterium]|nr:phytoene/squalene synthase family protein [Acidobacteriota bacterium]
MTALLPAASTSATVPVGTPRSTVSLEESYARCKELNRLYGTTYYRAAQVLPKVKRHHVHALYGFCRYADDIVDDLGPVPTDVRAKALADFGDRFYEDLDAGHSDDPVLKAVIHTVRAFDLPTDFFRRFLKSMTMDLTVDHYDTWDDLLDYMDGSAAVIGEMMLPILEPLRPEALPHARDLGNAFQLTNFLRDIAEDLDRNRQYVPQEDLRRFGVDLTTRRCTPEFVELMRFEIARCRELYVSADLGLAMLPTESAKCIGAARVLYGGILERIEAQQYDVFAKRAQVPTWRKALMVAKLTSPFGR